jgi:uncharacterized Zn finger protein
MTSARHGPARGKRAFAATWWGQAWVGALEDSTLDSGRLSRGRTYARQGMVGEVTVAPGVLRATVQGSRPRPYRSAVHVPVLTDVQWDTLLDAIAASAGHLAALLDGELPAEVVDDARAAGVPLLPLPHELDPECSCPDWGYPCKHAAALCYAAAATVDSDPFTLFALRGRTREAVLTALRARRTAGATAAPADPPTVSQGIPAAAAYAAWHTTAPKSPLFPELPPPTGEFGAALSLAPPPSSSLTTEDLTQLCADLAQRCLHLLAGDTIPLTLTGRDDALRLAADTPGVHWFHNLVHATGLRPTEFARLVRAWRHGGPAGVATAETVLNSDPAALAAARTALTEAAEDGDFTGPVGVLPLRAWRNRLTLGATGLQLRHGPDGRWHPYREESSGDWWPCAPADRDPVTALAGAWDQRR